MPIVADTHVHLYPCHDYAALLGGAIDRLRKAYRGSADLVLALTERADCSAFTGLRDGETRVAGFAVAALDATCLRLTRSDGAVIHVVAGRQIAARERLELLALGSDERIPDGLPIAETLRRIQATAAALVLAWAPGKWWFSRGPVVLDLLRSAQPGQLLIGDTALRPTLWPTPELMSYGATRGLKVIAGSDPLPAKGEEAEAGTYASFLPCALDANAPTASFLAALRDPEIRPVQIGHRGTAAHVMHRLHRYRSAGRRGL